MKCSIQRSKWSKSLKYSQKILLLIPILWFFSSCATQKKRSEASWLKKFYHNTTAYYNGYFNANLLLRESIDKLNLQHQDNFTKVLNVYPYLDVENPKAVASELDKATEKVSVVAAIHPVSHWVDDSYLMIAKCQYLKQDFESAEETLEYFKDVFKPNGKGRILGKDKKEIAKEKARAKEEAAETAAKERKRKADEKEKAKEVKEEEKKTAAEEKAELKKQAEKQKKERIKQREQERKQREKDRKKGIKVPPRTATEGVKPVTPTRTDSAATIAKKPVDPPVAAATTTDSNKVSRSELKQQPQKYTFKHRPCYQEGMLWLARTYTERQRYDEAISILNELESNPLTFEDIRNQTMVAIAHFYIKQKNYSMAIAPLTNALAATKKKSEKARFAFILGQLHQLAGRGKDAYNNFERVVAYHPSYEMEFNAKLNMALNGWQNGSSDLEETVKSLKRMLTDVKNKEYLDQVYFTLANLALKNKQDKEAIDYFKLALANNNNNKPIKLESYLAIARLYFAMERFVPSKAYYDSTMTAITKTDDRYNEVFTYSKGLTDIAANITIIEAQDSIIKIAGMSEKEKKALAGKILKEKKEKEQKEREIAEMRNGNVPTVAPTTTNTKSTFFAYNDKLVKKGKADFERRFGSRKLEDNWRRSNKRTSGDVASDDGNSDSGDADITDKEVAALFKDIPDSPEKIAAANEKIMNAMFALGGLYRERLQNAQKSAEILEKLNSKYPQSKHELDSWYLLYLSHSDLKNTARAKEYYDMILQKYPQSNYAKVLQDPDFLAKTKQEEKKIQYYYDSTFVAFKGGQYKVALDRSANAFTLFGNAATPLQPKFALLSALCIGNLQGKGAYVEALKEVVAKYPETQEQKRAKEILRFLDSDAAKSDSSRLKTMDTIVNSSFIIENEGLHYIIVFFDGTDIRIDDAKGQIADFNRQFFKLDQLKISNIFLGNDTRFPIVLVRKFDSKVAAMSYYSTIEKNKILFLNNSFKYQVYAVTQNNYRQILKEKTLDNYKQFFEENYK